MNRVLDKNFGASAYSEPATYYFGLSTTAPNIDGTGATEPSGGSYARVAFTNNKTNFGVASNAALTNLVAVTFPESSASWGTIVAVGMWDASSAGNLWWYDTLTPSRAVASLTTVLFAIGSVTVQMTNS
jgi:hypothetical protein